METEVPESWFAVWTRSRHEFAVRDRLAEKDVEVFLPTLSSWSKWKDRRKRVDKPVFPGYCFARFDPRNTMPILSCTGVASIVSVNGYPAPIPSVQIENVRLLVTSELAFDCCPALKEGMQAEVVAGPLRGMVGHLLRKDNGRARLVLSVDLIGQALTVEVSASDVEPV